MGRYGGRRAWRRGGARGGAGGGGACGGEGGGAPTAGSRPHQTGCSLRYGSACSRQSPYRTASTCGGRAGRSGCTRGGPPRPVMACPSMADGLPLPAAASATGLEWQMHAARRTRRHHSRRTPSCCSPQTSGWPCRTWGSAWPSSAGRRRAVPSAARWRQCQAGGRAARRSSRRCLRRAGMTATGRHSAGGWDQTRLRMVRAVRFSELDTCTNNNPEIKRPRDRITSPDNGSLCGQA